MSATENENEKKNEKGSSMSSPLVPRSMIPENLEDSVLLNLIRSGELPLLRPVVKKRPFPYYDKLVKLGDEPITFQSITDRKIIYDIALCEDRTAIEFDAYLIWKKWYAKRGKTMSREAQALELEWFRTRGYIDMLVRYVADAFGLTGDLRLALYRFAMRLYKKLEKERVSKWVEWANRELKVWEARGEVNPKALRAVAHLILKFLSDKYQV